MACKNRDTKTPIGRAVFEFSMGEFKNFFLLPARR